MFVNEFLIYIHLQASIRKHDYETTDEYKIGAFGEYPNDEEASGQFEPDMDS